MNQINTLAGLWSEVSSDEAVIELPKEIREMLRCAFYAGAISCNHLGNTEEVEIELAHYCHAQ